ncbi:MAG: L,D-transpeptidase [Marinilabiliales bacterium]|nr:MAG: L,D-transpeptidase [Marinilabiliales bacterium]
MVRIFNAPVVFKIFTLVLILGIGVTESSCQSQNKAKDYCQLLSKYSLNTNGKAIIIEKGSRKLSVLENGKVITTFEVTIGEEAGNKAKSGDNRTPEGVFLVQKIHDASNWVYYPDDDTTKGIENAYGPWFIRLKVPRFKGIGIHGYYHDDHIGSRASEGCVRLNNEELQELVDFVEVGMPVMIIPGKEDIKVNRRELNK